MSGWRDSAAFASVERLGGFLAANLITAVLLMTIVGAPFGLLGLFALMNAWTQGRQPQFFRVYFSAIRRHWRVGLGLGLIDALGFGLIIFNLSVFALRPPQDPLTMLSLTMTFSVCLVLVMANIYAWTLVSLLDLPLRGTIKLSLALALGKPLHSLLLTAAFLLPLFMSSNLPGAFMLVAPLVVSAYIGARGVYWVLGKQLSREEMAELLPDATA